MPVCGGEESGEEPSVEPAASRAAIAALAPMRTLDDEDEKGLSQEEWEQAWAAEIERRIREVREGTAELVDGHQALKQVRARVKPRRK